MLEISLKLPNIGHNWNLNKILDLRFSKLKPRKSNKCRSANPGTQLLGLSSGLCVPWLLLMVIAALALGAFKAILVGNSIRTAQVTTQGATF
jgi:hypothetical protein